MNGLASGLKWCGAGILRTCLFALVFVMLSLVVTSSVYAQEEKKTEVQAIKKNRDAKSAKDDKKEKSGVDEEKTATVEAVTAPSLSFEQQAKQWEAELDAIETVLEDGEGRDTVVFDEKREAVRRIRSQAQEENRIAQEVLNAKTTMLSTLGDAPAANTTGPVIPEDKKIISLRKQINDDIVVADARVKRSALVLGRAQAMLDEFTAFEQRELRRMLVARAEPVYSLDLWSGAWSEWAVYFEAENNKTVAEWYIFTSILLAIFIAYFYAPIVKWLNAWNQEVQMMPLRLPFFTGFFGCLCALGLRYDIYGIASSALLDNGLGIILVFVISISYWRMLVHVTFQVQEESASEDDDNSGYRHRGYWQKITSITRIANLAAMLLAIAGYVNMAAYISVNLFLTMMTVAGFVCARRVITIVIRRMNQVDKEILSPRHIIILEPVLLIPFAVIALFFWGVTPDVVRNWLDQYSGGIPVGSIVIDLSNFASAIAMLITLIMFTRLFQWFLGERVMQYAQVEKGVRNTVYSITGYVGYAIAILTALGTLGIEMANLAIVAGALSVGIGFGLQAIFNNFVSGLILLLERPVRVGDWIVVGALEGNVTKIRVRSTEITTFENASVIIPNSMLITESVKNWTLNDAVGRVDIKVGVAYDTDVQLVKKLLLKVAQDHPEVRKRPEIKVFFMDFGDSALLFELRCFIRNIDSRVSVMSDLRFRINEAFVKNNIVIPYPQRVVHTVTSFVDADKKTDEVKKEVVKQSTKEAAKDGAA